MKENSLKKFLKDRYYRISGDIRNKRLKNKDFTIISNNCFGGVVYRNNHIPYQSPTCGLFFMAPEYIKFIYDIKKYTSYVEIKEIPIEKSKYKEYLKETKYSGIIGVIDDLEICFLHYNNIKEINEKWNRRSKRINWNNIIYKFNDQNLCTYNELKKFDEFPAKNKICFTSKKYDDLITIQLKQYENDKYGISDTKERDYKRYFDIYDYINNIKNGGEDK